MDVLVSITTFVNSLMNALFRPLTGMIAAIPGWLSNMILSAVVGILAIVLFKYTSNQDAIGRVRDNIKAQMLGVKLFKDSMKVTLKLQGRMFKGALLLMFHSLRPMLVMIIPFSLVVAQMALWYQARPLVPGEQTVLTVKVDPAEINNIKLQTLTGARVTAGPVTAIDKNEINYQLQAAENGTHRIVFQVGDETFTKQLVIGEGFTRLSPVRPGREIAKMLMYPDEEPFTADSPVKSISLEYPDRISLTSGTDWWIAYFFIISLIAALIIKPFLKVKI